MNRQLSDSVPHVGVQLGEYHCPDAEITGKKSSPCSYPRRYNETDQQMDRTRGHRPCVLLKIPS